MQKKKALQFFDYLNNHVKVLNESKLFAGIMIIIINIASKYVSFKLSKTMESYLKFTFSRDILVFAIIWMGTRDIYIALAMTALFIFLVDFVMNENSSLCCLPTSFVDRHVSLLEGFNSCPSAEEVEKYRKIMEKIKKEDSVD